MCFTKETQEMRYFQDIKYRHSCSEYVCGRDGEREREREREEEKRRERDSPLKQTAESGGLY